MKTTGVSTVLAATTAIAAFVFLEQAAAQLPDPGMSITPSNTALVITDPQNDFLSPDGVTWGVVGESVTENNTVANIESLFKAAKNERLRSGSSRRIIITLTITAGSSRARWRR